MPNKGPNSGGAPSGGNTAPNGTAPGAGANGTPNGTAPGTGANGAPVAANTPAPITSIDLGDDNRINELSNRIKTEAIGKKTLDAVRASIDKEYVENIAKGLASDAMEGYKTISEIKAESDPKVKKRVGALKKIAVVSGAAFLGFMGAGFIGAGAVALGALAKKTVMRSLDKSSTLKNYYEVAKQAILETGNLDAGAAAVAILQESDTREKFSWRKTAKKERSDIVEGLKGNYKAGEGSERFVFERAKEAFRDKSVRDLYTDNGEFFEKNVEVDENTSLLKGFLGDYASAYVSAKGDKDAQDKALSDFNDKFETWSEDNKSMDGVNIKGNYDNLLLKVREIADKTQKELFAKDEFKDYSDAEKSLALKRAVEDKFRLNVADMKAGLNTNEILTLSEKASIRGGVVWGAVVGLGSELSKTVSRSVVLQFVGRSLPATMSIAAILGGVTTGIKKSRELKRENIKEALGQDDDGNNSASQSATNASTTNKKSLFSKLRDRMKRVDEFMEDGKTKFDMFDVDKEADVMAEINSKLSSKRNKPSAEEIENLKERALGIMARYEAVNRLQNQNKNKFKLLRFTGGRESIEESRLRITRRMLALKKTLRANNVQDVNKVIAERTENFIERLGEDVNQVKQSRKNAILWAGFKSAAVAAGVSSATRGIFAGLNKIGAMDLLTKGGRAAENWRAGVFSKINTALGGKDDNWLMSWVNKTSIFGGGVAATKKNGNDDNKNKVDEGGEKPNGDGEVKEVHENEMNAETVREKNAEMLVEDDPEGGVSVGFDMDGDGQLDSGEYLVGEGEAAGINFNNPEEYEAFKNRMESEFRMTVEKGQYDTDTFANIKVKDFVGQQNNVVNIDVNNLSEKSKTMVVIHRPTTTTAIDGMNYFEVKIDGNIPEGASAYIDLDGDGPMQALEFDIHNGKVLVPAGAVDTDSYMANGKANFLGKFIVGREDVDGSFISYGADSGKVLSGDTVVKATERVRGSLITVINQDDGNAWSQFAIRGDGAKETAENLSHLFNGIERGRIPKSFVVPDSDNGRGPVRLANGAEIEDLDYKGGHRPEYDSGLNDIHKTGGNHSLVGIPFEADANGDGVLDQAESARFVRQWLVATGTDANVLAQNAANFGMLEPDVLRDTLFNGDDELMMNTLRAWGINDGVISNLSELDAFMDQLKLSANADLYDRLVNSTITEMQDQMQGCTLSLETITNRNSTYSLKGDLAISSNGTRRQAIYFFREGEGGSREYIGNKGFLAKELGAGENGRVGVMANCRQSEVEKKVTSERTKTSSEKTSEKSAAEKTTTEKQTNEKTTVEKQTNEKTTVEKTDPENTKTTVEKTDPENTKTTEKQTNEKTTVEKTDPENTKASPEKTDPENTKTTAEKTDPENTKTDPENNITPKTGDMNAGPNVTQLDETPAPKADTVYVEATPDNRVTAEVKPGAPVHDADASVYANDTVLDEVTGEPLKDSAGNIYITKPEELINEATPSGVSGEALKEEIAQNIADDTQTTYTPDTTKWQSGATETVLPDLNAAVDNASSATEGVVNDVVDNTASNVTSNAASNIVEEATEEIPIIGGGGNTNYDEDELAELLGLKPAA